MSKRKYTHMKDMETQIINMREAGMSRQAIAEELDLEIKQIKNWITRYNRKQVEIAAMMPPKRKGRPRRRPLSSTDAYEKEISRLEMENKLLWDFLQSVERM